MLGLAVVAASIVVANSIHRPIYTGSCIRAPCPQTADYPVAFRLAIVAAGLLVAAIVIAIGSYTQRRRR
jgi:hypothetical protein